MDERAALTRALIAALAGGRREASGAVGEALDLGARVGALAAIEAALDGARIVRFLGAGGMGRVYVAEPARDGRRRFAVKVMHPELVRSREARRRFLREAEAARRVRHPGVVGLIDAHIVDFPGGPMPVLAMEMVSGRTLRADIDARGALPERECRRIAIEAARALAAIHAAGIVHRDVKPGNVMRSRRGVVKILDLGVSRLADATSPLTRTGRFVGTFDYAAPEQFDRSFGPLDGRADLYALGATLFEALTGRLPWPVDEAGTVLAQASPLRVSDLRPRIDPALDDVVARLLRTRVEERPQTAESVADALESTPVSRRSRHPATSRKPAARAAPSLVELLDDRGGPVLLVSAQARGATTKLGATARAQTARGRLVLRGRYGGGRDAAFDAVGTLLPAGSAWRPEAWPTDARTFAVLDCLRRASAAKPVVLLLDRLDHADPAALATFAALVAEVRELRVRIVATWRTADERTIPEWLAAAARVVGA